MSPRKWSSTRHSSRASWKLRNTWPALCTTFTSNRSTRNSNPAQSGVSPMRSRRRFVDSTFSSFGNVLAGRTQDFRRQFSIGIADTTRILTSTVRSTSIQVCTRNNDQLPT